MSVQVVGNLNTELSKNPALAITLANFATILEKIGITQDLVVTTQDEIDHNQQELEFLSCLRSAGVDNWPGYADACEIFNTLEENNESHE